MVQLGGINVRSIWAGCRQIIVLYKPSQLLMGGVLLGDPLYACVRNCG